jgi:glucose-1-phosphate cytidylyltransferase
MKVVILAGGMGTRIGEESQLRPKPMIQIGDKPILWHIMKHYSSYGFNEFIICCGYKGHMIKQYFANYYNKYSDVNINLRDGKVAYINSVVEPWKVTLVNTGLRTMTAGRILKVKDYIQEDEFMLTYGDGVSDVDIHKLLECHHRNNRISTITVTKPEGRFGAVKIDENKSAVDNFKEKARKDQSWVNAGFAVFSTKVFEYLGNGSQMLESEPFERLVEANEMTVYQHHGFWSPMDTLKDKKYLEDLWNSGQASWSREGSYI